MRATTLLVALLVIGSAVALLPPTADARQACVGLKDSTCPGLVCVWDRVNAKWRCYGEYYPPPCWSCPMMAGPQVLP